MSTYKPAKTLDEQIKYLKENKRVCFNIIDEKHINRTSQKEKIYASGTIERG